MILSNLTVCTVNWWSLEYVRFLDFTLRTLGDTPDFRWLICNTNSNNAQGAELEALPNSRVVYRDLDGLSGSIAHGTGLNALIPHIQTEFTLIVDPDSAVLAAGWDTLCKRELKEEGVVAIGAPYNAYMGERRYGDFPTVFFVMCRTDLLQRYEVDMRPSWATWYGSLRRKLRRFGGLFDTDLDTGWRLRQVAHRHGLSGKRFQWLNASSRGVEVLRHGERGDEYHWDGHPIFSHQGRSSKRVPFQGDVSVRWFLAICHYLNVVPAQISERLQLDVNFASVKNHRAIT